MRIIDLSNIATGNLVQNGFFDVYPSSDSAAFDELFTRHARPLREFIEIRLDRRLRGRIDA